MGFPQLFFVFALIQSVELLHAQTELMQDHVVANQTEFMLRDTIAEFVFDSTKHDLGEIEPNNQHNRLIKHFKYIGENPISITRAWTGDPHYICEYPQEILIPQLVYAFTICFHHEGRQGYMLKDMGFDLSNGERIFLQFKGHYIDNTTEK